MQNLYFCIVKITSKQSTAEVVLWPKWCKNTVFVRVLWYMLKKNKNGGGKIFGIYTEVWFRNIQKSAFSSAFRCTGLPVKVTVKQSKNIEGKCKTFEVKVTKVEE